MKRGTKISVFIASMALTVGSLVAFVSPRHCSNQGMYGPCETIHNNYDHAIWNNHSRIDSAKIN